MEYIYRGPYVEDEMYVHMRATLKMFQKMELKSNRYKYTIYFSI